MKRLLKGEILVLRSCKAGGVSERQFVWPLTVGAVVGAPDWQDTDKCGHGLHGLPWGHGGDYCNNSALVWLVLRVSTAKGNYQHGTGDMIDKCKFRACTVEGVFDNSKDATDMILAYAPAGTVCNYATVTSGDWGTSTSGNMGTSTSGYGGTSTSGYMGTSTSGNMGTSTSGDWGTSTSGDMGTSTSGNMGTSTSGYGGTSTSGYMGTSTSGNMGTSTSGYMGTLCWRVWDGNRYRLHVRYTGEDGIEAGKAYKYENGQIVEVSK